MLGQNRLLIKHTTVDFNIICVPELEGGRTDKNNLEFWNKWVKYGSDSHFDLDTQFLPF